MTQNDTTTSMQDIAYKMPPDVLHFETRYIFGLSIYEMMYIAMPMVGVMMFLGLLAGFLVAVFGLVATMRMERLQGRSLPIYFFYKIMHAQKKDKQVTMPLMLPARQDALIVFSWRDRSRPKTVISSWEKRTEIGNAVPATPTNLGERTSWRTTRAEDLSNGKQG
jgi:hypothetical protein